MNGYRLGVISRNDGWLRRIDTVDINRAKRQIRLRYRRNYALNYHLRGFAADGVKLAKAFSQPLPDGWMLDWGVAASALKGKRVRVEDITGNATGTGGSTYNATVEWRRDYSHTDTIKESFWPQNQIGNPWARVFHRLSTVGRSDGLDGVDYRRRSRT
jgi:hypothetical protein